MLEINPNCDVAYPLEEAGSADLILLHEPWATGVLENNQSCVETTLPPTQEMASLPGWEESLWDVRR